VGGGTSRPAGLRQIVLMNILPCDRTYPSLVAVVDEVVDDERVVGVLLRLRVKLRIHFYMTVKMRIHFQNTTKHKVNSFKRFFSS
jgi:hypothetical protein